MEAPEHSPELLEIIDKWLEITIDRLHNALDEHEIGKLDGDLWKSIVGEVVASGGNVESVMVKFMQYGRFVDMGVGRGMTTGSRKELGDQKFFKKRNAGGQLHKYLRKPKPWYSKTKKREVARLREIMAAKLCKQALQDVETAIEKGMIVDFAA